MTCTVEIVPTYQEDLCGGERKNAKCVYDTNNYIDLAIEADSSQEDINQAVYNALQASKATTNELQFQIDEIVPTLTDSRPYKVYVAILNQTDTDPPVATIMENNIGDIVISYVSAGIYLFTLASAFTLNKTVLIKLSNGENRNGTNYIFTNLTTDSFNFAGNVGSGGADNQLVNFPIEIRVYN